VGTHYRPDYRLLGLRALPPTTLAQCGLLTIREPDRSSFGAAIVWWWNARKAVSQPLNRGIRAVSPRRPVPNARHEHHPHFATRAAQGGHVALRHRRPDQLVGGALCKEDWDPSRQRASPFVTATCRAMPK
jgi:hypothetical protein